MDVETRHGSRDRQFFFALSECSSKAAAVTPGTDAAPSRLIPRKDYPPSHSSKRTIVLVWMRLTVKPTRAPAP